MSKTRLSIVCPIWSKRTLMRRIAGNRYEAPLVATTEQTLSRLVKHRAYARGKALGIFMRNALQTNALRICGLPIRFR